MVIVVNVDDLLLLRSTPGHMYASSTCLAVYSAETDNMIVIPGDFSQTTEEENNIRLQQELTDFLES